MRKTISISGIYYRFLYHPEKIIEGSRLSGLTASEIIRKGLDLLMDSEIKFSKRAEVDSSKSKKANK